MPIDINHRPPGRAQDVTVEGFIATVVVMCPCGNRKPIICPVIPGAGGAGQCAKCQVTWRCEKIEYEEIYSKAGEEAQPIKCTIKMQGIIPSIIVPGNGGEKRMVF